MTKPVNQDVWRSDLEKALYFRDRITGLPETVGCTSIINLIRSMTPQTHNYVGFWKRCAASIIDSILLCIVIYPPLLLIYGLPYFDLDETGFIAGTADLFFSWILPFILVIAFWIRKQATPGKMIINAKIIDARTGQRPTLKQWIARYIGYFLGALPLGLGYFWAAFDSRKQGWHDKIAGTIVVRS